MRVSEKYPEVEIIYEKTNFILLVLLIKIINFLSMDLILFLVKSIIPREGLPAVIGNRPNVIISDIFKIEITEEMYNYGLENIKPLNFPIKQKLQNIT